MGQLTATGEGQGPNANLVEVHSEEVCTDARLPEYVGATKHTNNTGELTALRRAVSNALQRRRGAGREEIHSDSLYSINMTTGRWRPKKKANAELIEDLRCMWRHLQRTRPNEVTLKHVRSHVQVPGNELADWLADHGRYQSNTISLAAAQEWLADKLEAWGGERPGDTGPHLGHVHGGGIGEGGDG